MLFSMGLHACRFLFYALVGDTCFALKSVIFICSAVKEIQLNHKLEAKTKCTDARDLQRNEYEAAVSNLLHCQAVKRTEA